MENHSIDCEPYVVVFLRTSWSLTQFLSCIRLLLNASSDVRVNPVKAFVPALYRAPHRRHLHELLPTAVLWRIRASSRVYSMPTKKNGEGTPGTRLHGIPRRVMYNSTTLSCFPLGLTGCSCYCGSTQRGQHRKITQTLSGSA